MEYKYLLGLLQGAIDQARKGGHLGNFEITIREGAGAYVCGEESALMESIEATSRPFCQEWRALTMRRA